MKKLIIGFLFIAYTQLFYAQEEKSVRFTFMLNPQISWLNSDLEGVEHGGNLFGYNFGVSLNRFFATNYSFHTGLTINTTGGTLKYQTDPALPNSFDKVSMRLKYLEIPFGLHLKTNEFRRMTYYGQFGLSTQINIKATDGDGKSLNSSIRLFELGYHFGGGVEYSIGGTNYLMLGLQFNNGITDITKDDRFNDKTNLNRLVFQFGLIF